jgi:hypothetical protein
LPVFEKYRKLRKEPSDKTRSGSPSRSKSARAGRTSLLVSTAANGSAAPVRFANAGLEEVPVFSK